MEAAGKGVTVNVTVTEGLVLVLDPHQAGNVSDGNVPFSDIDRTLSVLVILLTVVGLASNVACFYYFWQRKRKSIYDIIYTLICGVDVFICMMTFPVIVNLIDERSGDLFTYSAFCYAWPVLYYLNLRMSLMLAMVLSVTRTMAVTCPLYNLNKKGKSLMTTLVMYGIGILIIDLIFTMTKSLDILYNSTIGFCELYPFADPSTTPTPSLLPISIGIYSVILQLELLVPSVVVFVSFVLSTRSLARHGCIRSEDERKFRRITTTIALFTALFIACNLPCTLLQAAYFLNYISRTRLLRTGLVFDRYAHLASHFLFPLLNASLNPSLYFLRMSQLRGWGKEKLQGVLERVFLAPTRERRFLSLDDSRSEGSVRKMDQDV